MFQKESTSLVASKKNVIQDVYYLEHEYRTDVGTKVELTKASPWTHSLPRNDDIPPKVSFYSWSISRLDVTVDLRVVGELDV